MTVSDRSGIRWTIFGVLVFMAIVVASFVHRVGEPRVMSLAESRINGLFLFDYSKNKDKCYTHGLNLFFINSLLIFQHGC